MPSLPGTATAATEYHRGPSPACDPLITRSMTTARPACHSLLVARYIIRRPGPGAYRNRTTAPPITRPTS